MLVNIFSSYYFTYYCLIIISLGDPYGADDFNAPSCSAVVELFPGDQVYVTSSNGNPLYCPDCAGFSGFLIKPYF